MVAVQRLDDQVSAAGQPQLTDFAGLADQGFQTVVNNRPEGESADQPGTIEEATAAAAHGMTYHHIPFTMASLGPEEVAAFRRVLAEAPGPILVHCRSGSRSAHLWALARAAEGADPDRLVRDAAAAGFDISAIRPRLTRE